MGSRKPNRKPKKKPAPEAVANAGPKPGDYPFPVEYRDGVLCRSTDGKPATEVAAELAGKK